MRDCSSPWRKPADTSSWENVISLEMRCVAEFHLFTPERRKKGQGRRGIKAGKGDAVSKNCSEKMNGGSDLFHLFFAQHTGNSYQSCLLQSSFRYLERDRLKITVCSLYLPLRAAYWWMCSSDPGVKSIAVPGFEMQFCGFVVGTVHVQSRSSAHSSLS